MRPDIYIVDDRTRRDDNLGEVQDVFKKFLGNGPVFTIRLNGAVDGMEALNTEFDNSRIPSEMARRSVR